MVTSLSSLSVLLMADSSSDSSKASFLAWSSLANTDSLCACRNASARGLTVSTGCRICNGRNQSNMCTAAVACKGDKQHRVACKKCTSQPNSSKCSKCQNSSQTLLLMIAWTAQTYTNTHLGGALTSILSAMVWSIMYAQHRGSAGISVRMCVYICTCTLYDDSAIDYTCTRIIMSLCNGV